MVEEKPKKETKPKEPTQEEVRELIKKDLSFFEMISNKIHHIKENGCLSVNMETEVREEIEKQVRTIIGLPPKQTPPPYTPPPPPVQQPPQVYGVPPRPPQTPV